MRRLCYFHAGCPDGFGAAWAVWRAWGSGGRYLPRGHEDGLELRQVVDAQVVFVDIAPSNELLRQIASQARQVVVLDHHVSSRERYVSDPGLHEEIQRGGHEVSYDLSHSGAVLAWQHFHPREPTPALLRYVEDQDLWSWKLPDSEPVNAAIGSYPRDFETWDELAARPLEELVEEGTPILRSQRIEVERVVKSAHPLRLDGRRIEAVNAPNLRSSIGHELAQRASFGLPWGAVYRLNGRRVDVSVYSIGELDVSRVAARYGGGGHRNAAGFSVSLEEWQASFA